MGSRQVTQHMQIPLSYADAVIGEAGANISYIRRASGATITIQETRGVPGEMTVEITGSATQVQTAQQLIQACPSHKIFLIFVVFTLDELDVAVNFAHLLIFHAESLPLLMFV